MSKRGSIFDQGKPENPYNEREDSPADPPRKATAAQLAGRKLKAAKGVRRPAGVTSGIVASPNPFGASPGSGFTFGAESNNHANAPSPNVFGNNNSQSTQNGTAFGATTSSFPPTQPSTQNNIFSNSSFPAFGGSNTNTAFNPQPPSSTFNFSVGNPFTASAPAPALSTATNGAGDGTKPSGSIFNFGATKQSDPVGTSSMSQNNTFGAFGGSSTFGQSNPFGTTSAPTNTTFGGSSLAPSSTAAMNSGFGTSTAPQTNAFGATSTPQSSGFGSTGVTSGGMFGTSSAPQTNPFGTFGSGAPNSNAAVTSAPQNNATSTAPVKSQAPAFTFGASTAASPSLNPTTTIQTGFGFSGAGSQETKDSSKAPESGFNFLGATKSEAAKSTPAPAKNLFAGFGDKSTATQPNTPASSGIQFGSVSAAPTQSSTPGPTSFNFASTSSGPTQSSTPASTGFKFEPTSSGPTQSSTPASTGFKFGLTSSGPAQPSTTASTGFKFGGFGTSVPLPSSNTPATANDSSTKETAEKASASTLFSKNVPGGLFSGVSSTSQTKTPELQSTMGSSSAGLQNPFGGLPNNSASTPQGPKTTSLFANTPASFTPKTSAPKMGDTGSGPSPSLFSKAEAGKAISGADQQPASLFSSVKPSATVSTETSQKISTPKADSMNTFNRPTPAKASTPLSPASAMPTLTGAVAPPAAATTESSAPKVYVAQNWPVPNSTSNDLAELTRELARFNNGFRAKLAGLSLTADWSNLSRWHLDVTVPIIKKIKALRKQSAAAKGITGNESSLSVKRGADEEGSRDAHEGSPTKKQRADPVPDSPMPNSTSLFTTTPKAAPPASSIATLFGSAISKSSPPTSEGPAKDAEPSKPFGQQSTGNAKQAENPAKSLFDATSKAPGASSLFKSPFEMPKAHSANSTAKSGGKFDFMAQFGKASKSAEELRAERKKKAKLEDYDSDEETEEAWSARWDKEEEERVAKQKEKLKEQATSKPTTETASASSIFKPASGASSPGLFGSRPASPALPNGGGNSVFDTPAGANTPTQGNIFGHLSSAPSSNNQDDDEDEDENEEEEEQEKDKSSQAKQQPAEPGFSKHKLNQTDSESDETLEEVLRHKKQDTAKKPALIDRITRADPAEVDTSESEKDDSKTSTSFFSSQANGTSTPASKPKHFFDFAAAGAQTAPPKQDTFAGDQTFKPGTPIKFGTATKGQPIFQFQPSTPAASELSTTPSKPPPSTFSFLNAANTPSGLGSGLSTRAPTPLSEAESGRDSAAENEDGEGTTSEQLDLSGLTEEEKAQNDVLFSTPKAVAKHQVTKSSGDKVWEAFVNGPLWIIKNRETGKAIVRMRLLSGTTKLNYNILPNCKATVAGASKKMVTTMGVKLDGRAMPLFFCMSSAEVAEEFARVYNENGP